MTVSTKQYTFCLLSVVTTSRDIVSLPIWDRIFPYDKIPVQNMHFGAAFTATRHTFHVDVLFSMVHTEPPTTYVNACPCTSKCQMTFFSGSNSFRLFNITHGHSGGKHILTQQIKSVCRRRRKLLPYLDFKVIGPGFCKAVSHWGHQASKECLRIPTPIFTLRKNGFHKLTALSSHLQLLKIDTIV